MAEEASLKNYVSFSPVATSVPEEINQGKSGGASYREELGRVAIGVIKVGRCVTHLLVQSTI